MHVPEKHLELYRAIVTLARKADSIGNTYSGKGHYADANRVWSVAGDLRVAAARLREPGQGEAEKLNTT